MEIGGNGDFGQHVAHYVVGVIKQERGIAMIRFHFTVELTALKMLFTQSHWIVQEFSNNEKISLVMNSLVQVC